MILVWGSHMESRPNVVKHEPMSQWICTHLWHELNAIPYEFMRETKHRLVI